MNDTTKYRLDGRLDINTELTQGVVRGRLLSTLAVIFNDTR